MLLKCMMHILLARPFGRSFVSALSFHLIQIYNSNLRDEPMKISNYFILGDPVQYFNPHDAVLGQY